MCCVHAVSFSWITGRVHELFKDGKDLDVHFPLQRVILLVDQSL